MSSEQQQHQQICDRLNEIGAALRSEPTVRDSVIRRIRSENFRRANAPSFLNRWWGLATTMAAILVLMFVLVQVVAGLRASEAFAAAIDRVAKAHTFSCRQITQEAGADGKLQIHETTYMFKEPDRSRVQYSPNWMGNETMITDYAKHRRLTLIPEDMVADLQDTSDMYAVDENGDLKPAQLETDVRDEVMKLTAESVKNLGTKELNGKTVRVLQSRGKESVRTVYLDPQTQHPVQIEITWPKNPQSKFTYADIRIDEDLDDKLFSLDVPEGYKLFKGGPYVPAQAYYSKMMTKMRNLAMACIVYADEHKGRYPAELKDLIGSDGMTAEKLAKLIASPDKLNGPPAIVYRKPPAGKYDGNAIILYEAPEQRRDGKVAAAMLDGHAQILSQKEFDEMMK